MSNVLDRIVEQTLSDLAKRKKAPPQFPTEPRQVPHTLSAALRQEGLGLIAEVKPKSPSAGELFDRAKLPELLRIYSRHAQALSVLIDTPFFGGGLDLLQEVRQAVSLPLLAKGFILDPYQIQEASAYGANAILLIVRILDDIQLKDLLQTATDLGLDALVEAHNDHELERAIDAESRIIGINARDLDRLTIDLEAMRERLQRVPSACIRVAESGLDTPEHIARIKPVADAALIGTAFLSTPNVEEKMESLGW